jgi:acyl transferase domain-containing protein/acyl carrier protein
MTSNEQPQRKPGTGRLQPIAVVGMGAIMPEAPTAAAFWANITGGRYCITDVPKDRWDPELYYDPDPRAPDKTYSRIGGWVRDFPWDPIGWHLPLPPKVSDQMDDGQKWAVAAAREALFDAGWPNWNIDPERVAVVIGNAIGGEKHYATNLRIQLPEFTRELTRSAAFAALPSATRAAIIAETSRTFHGLFPEITEDTMPGELSNILAGRIANLFNFRGASFTTDAACASGLAALSAAAQDLAEGQCDAAVAGGVDRNMGVAAFVKFCKIGALSATGTRPFDAGADGFVMGEGAALFVLKRLADAERDGDRIYAVLLGIAGSSDGKGKGITAPNPAGQRLAVARAWANAGVDLASVSCVEAHGTSTRVGDAAELESLTSVFRPGDFAPASIALGSVKSNIGHLKAAAGTAGLFKQVMALHQKVLPPSLNFREPNPNVDWAACPFRVNSELREWPAPVGGVRRAGISAFGFGGTNFHAVVEEYIPGLHDAEVRRTFASSELPKASVSSPVGESSAHVAQATEPAAQPSADRHGTEHSADVKVPLRGALVVGGNSEAEVAAQLTRIRDRAAAGEAPAIAPPDPDLATANVRVAIDYGAAAELADKAGKAAQALTSRAPELRRMLHSRGVFIGYGPAPKTAFLYTGQGSQYVNMLRELRETEPIVAETFAEADEVMTPLLGKPLTDLIFVDHDDPAAVAQAEGQLLQTEITQPAVLATDMALTRLLGAYGIKPDMVMGHSLGEYGALIAAGAMSFEAALEAVSARGREMASLSVPDKGAMAAVMAPLDEIERIVASVDGYVVTANINSTHQAVIGGATEAVERAIAAFAGAGYNAARIPVSHAFHTAIVAPASEPLRRTLARLALRPPALPIVANVDGGFYPADGPGVTERMLDILGRQVASPVQFVKGLRTLYDAGARVFVEVGPKRALQGFAEDVLGTAHEDVLTLFTNHPKNGDMPSFNAALCGLYAAGLGFPAQRSQAPASALSYLRAGQPSATARVTAETSAITSPIAAGAAMSDERRYAELGRLVVDLIDRSRSVLAGAPQTAAATATGPVTTVAATPEGVLPSPAEPVVIAGAALGLPGTERVFDDENVARILSGEQFIDVIPRQVRREMVDKHITRLVKSDTGDPVFETIDSEGDVIKLAGRYGSFDLVDEFGVDADRNAALDQCTRLAIGAGLDAMRDAGIPLVQHYHTTTLGTKLPDRWGLPAQLRDDTGVVFASAFPGYESFAQDLNNYHEDRARRHELSVLEDVRDRMSAQDAARSDVDRRIAELRHWLQSHAFKFDRRFLFRVLAMGHSQFAELIGARGPNTQVNSACASTAQAICLAEDWIRAGRCRRVVVVSADNAASDVMLPWAGSGFLASGAAATDAVVEDAVLPFDRRRHGMIIGSGAAALVVESAESARERGIRPICEVVAAVTANSAFHGTRLDTEHIAQVMEQLIRQAERRGIDRRAIADQTVFVSHETYTPARGGSASAEVSALRHVFGDAAASIVIANTKGFTGHAMAAGIEEVVAVKALETGIVPPVPNLREPDPELGQLNLSRGGAYPVKYALRLAAGFGSQISMTLLHWVEPPDGAHRAPSELGFGYRIADDKTWRSWLASVSGHDDAQLEVVQRRLRVADDMAGKQPVTTPVAEATPAASRQTRVASPAPAGPAWVDGSTAPTPTTQTGPAAPAATTSADEAAVTASPTPGASAAPAAQTAEPGGDPIASAVLDVVENLTGYPRDLLDLDLDMEADLGVDTVKQAEVFAAVRERFGIPRQDNLKLRDFPTLAHVIGFVHEHAVPSQPPAAEPAVAAAPPAAEPTPAGAAPQAAPAGDPIASAVLDVVENLTGYPRDLLDLDLDMEADLGVDTVKQAEVFAAVRERFGIPRQDNLKLRDFPTLAHVIGFVHEHAVPEPAEPAEQAAAPAPQALTHVETAFTGDMSAAERLPRRLPVPVLRPPAAWCKPTGVVLDQTSRVIVMADEGGVTAALIRRLGALGVGTLVIEPGCTTADIESQLTEWLADGPVHGLYWLAALDSEPPIGELDLPGWHEALRRRVKNMYAVVRRLDTHGQLGPAGTFVVAATRLGGYHGYDEAGATAPLGGAVTGFTKAYSRERPDVLAKAVDFPAMRKTAVVADALIEETLSDPGAVEIGRADGRRWTVGLREVPFGNDGGGMSLGTQTVFAVTGAAGSIVSAIVADLAKASGGVFHLMDLTPEPDPGDPDLIQFATDREGLRKKITERLADSGTRPTPVLIERELARYERLHSALTAIHAVRAAGGEAHYHAVDLTDPEAVAKVVADIRARHEHLDVLVHAAGLDVSRSIADKEPREYDLVFDVKSDGLFNFLHAAADLPVGAVVVFSSVAGRFGNAGQTDYSAANDLECKITSSFRTTRPGTRGIAIDWTAWGGLGMATRGSVPKVMAMAGIEMLEPQAGIPWIRRELTAGPFRGEVVVGGQLGLLTTERDVSGGLDADMIDTTAAGPMIGTISGMGVYSGLTAETTLDPAEQPFLHDHRIDSAPVLPGVMGIEAFAALASLAAPDLQVAGVEQVDFIAPVKFYRDEPRTVSISAVIRRAGAELLAECTLSASRMIKGEQVPRVTTHFTGQVRLAPVPLKAERGTPPGSRPAAAVTHDDVYRVFFHGPAYQVVDEAWHHGSDAVTRLARHLPAAYAPATGQTTTEPRLAEACFQTAGLWEVGQAGHLALPAHVDQVSMLHRPVPDSELFAMARQSGDGSFDCQVVDTDGDVLVRVKGYRTIGLGNTLPAELQQPIHDAMSA